MISEEAPGKLAPAWRVSFTVARYEYLQSCRVTGLEASLALGTRAGIFRTHVDSTSARREVEKAKGWVFAKTNKGGVCKEEMLAEGDDGTWGRPQNAKYDAKLLYQYQCS